MSVVRVDGTAARPLDGQEQRRRRSPARSRSGAASQPGQPETQAKARQATKPNQNPAPAPAPAARMSFGRIMLFATCWALLVVGAVAVVSRQSEMATLGYRITAAQERLAHLEHENMLLEAEIARLEDPERIYYIATEEFGMVPRDRFEVAVVEQAAPIVRNNSRATIAALGSAVQEQAAAEGFWPELGRSLVGWLTGKPHTAAAKTPDQ